MTVEQLITQYGYVALFLGTCFEGETFLLIAGFAAHRSYLALHWVWLVAFTGSTLMDQVWFYLGRWRGMALVNRRRSWQRGAERIRPWLAKHNTPVVLSFRFVPGTRTITPILLGAAGFSPGRFALLNLLGAAVWAVVIGTAGYLFGEVLEHVFQKIEHYEARVILVIAALGAAAWVIRRIRIRAASRSADQGPLSRPSSKQTSEEIP